MSLKGFCTMRVEFATCEPITIWTTGSVMQCAAVITDRLVISWPEHLLGSR